MGEAWARRVVCWVAGGLLAFVLGAVAGWLIHPAAELPTGVVAAITLGWNIERIIERNPR